MAHTKLASEVFGISTGILPDSYVDRGSLDEELTKYLARDNHVAIRGASKTGKSWLRQRVVQSALIVQCRLGKTLEDIYRELLGQLGVELTVSEASTNSIHGRLEAQTELGVSLIGRVRAKLSASTGESVRTDTENLSDSLSDLDFICRVIAESGRQVIIEDFHYLSEHERRRLSFDLKAMWDLSLFVIVVGVWSDKNLLLNLNPDLTGRVRELSVVWSDEDLRQILKNGSEALNIVFSREVESELVEISYGNAGILQRLALDTLDAAGYSEAQKHRTRITEVRHVHDASMYYAEELNSVYQTFAQSVSSGIRSRKNATGIYAHALAVILDSSDEELKVGVGVDRIFEVAHSRESRIQKGNLKTALGKLERLQVDDGGRGLVLSYAEGRVRVVDHQLLLYRRFATVQWPWEELIAQADAAGESYEDPVDLGNLA